MNWKGILDGGHMTGDAMDGGHVKAEGSALLSDGGRVIDNTDGGTLLQIIV